MRQVFSGLRPWAHNESSAGWKGRQISEMVKVSMAIDDSGDGFERDAVGLEETNDAWRERHFPIFAILDVGLIGVLRSLPGTGKDSSWH